LENGVNSKIKLKILIIQAIFFQNYLLPFKCQLIEEFSLMIKLRFKIQLFFKTKYNKLIQAKLRTKTPDGIADSDENGRLLI